MNRLFFYKAPSMVLALYLFASVSLAQKSTTAVLNTLVEYDVYHKKSKKTSKHYFLTSKENQNMFAEVAEVKGNVQFVWHQNGRKLTYEFDNMTSIIEADTLQLFAPEPKSEKGTSVVGDKLSFKIKVKEDKKTRETACYVVKTFVHFNDKYTVHYSTDRYTIFHDAQSPPLQPFIRFQPDVAAYNGGITNGVVTKMVRWDDYALKDVVLTFNSKKQHTVVLQIETE